MTKLSKDIVAAFGTVDILVNSQGQNIKQPFGEFPLGDWNTLFEANIKSVMLACQEFGKIMLAKKRGKIINISSAVGRWAPPLAGNAGYSSTKGAVYQITRSLAFE
jgi:NAD(P)-dependent dehydrogenase (short-subunit alcohol dehydrogenase family)